MVPLVDAQRFLMDCHEVADRDDGPVEAVCGTCENGSPETQGDQEK